ncbi:type II toxin-antitoxin system PemK/MazF family toxin [Pygmaiobacter massiliensis]|uniref:type II toxin-antitoxin system PemK/MazF family toxin n=1 Tax=Pygmaiobacter massiliensis TaxID=1917873 RepID=UPI0028A1208D|nr:type II toxin-antitoxin system PemK/MazF family toxin [Pygmaiobacter massiliensis]
MNQTIQSISRGDVFYADLSPVVGCEQGGIRPVLILQNDVGNRHSPTTIVCAITGSIEKKVLPTHVFIGRVGKLSKTSVALLEQLRTIDRSRLQGRIGRLSVSKIAEIDHALAVSIGLAALF